MENVIISPHSISLGNHFAGGHTEQAGEARADAAAAIFGHRTAAKSRFTLHRVTRTIVTAVALLCPIKGRAAPLPDAHRVINYSVIDQDLKGVLTGIAAELGLRTEISGHVHGQVQGHLPPAQAAVMLDRLAALYGFDWYYDDRTLFVTSYEEAVSKIMPLGAVSANSLLETLRQLGVSDNRWPVRIAPASEVAAVDGPPHYAMLVDQTLAALAAGAKTGVAEVRVFRGSAASQ